MNFGGDNSLTKMGCEDPWVNEFILSPVNRPRFG